LLKSGEKTNEEAMGVLKESMNQVAEATNNGADKIVDALWKAMGPLQGIIKEGNQMLTEAVSTRPDEQAVFDIGQQGLEAQESGGEGLLHKTWNMIKSVIPSTNKEIPQAITPEPAHPSLYPPENMPKRRIETQKQTAAIPADNTKAQVASSLEQARLALLTMRAGQGATLAQGQHELDAIRKQAAIDASTAKAQGPTTERGRFVTQMKNVERLGGGTVITDAETRGGDKSLNAKFMKERQYLMDTLKIGKAEASKMLDKMRVEEQKLSLDHRGAQSVVGAAHTRRNEAAQNTAAATTQKQQVKHEVGVHFTYEPGLEKLIKAKVTEVNRASHVDGDDHQR
jgi:hypothetical protein